MGVIASSPTDIQPVLDVVAANAARLCGATDAVITGLMVTALSGAITVRCRHGTGSINQPQNYPVPGDRFNRRTVHVADLLATLPEVRLPRRLPEVTAYSYSLATPLLREGTSHRGDSRSSHGGPPVLRISRSSCLKPSPPKQSSPSRTCACSKSSRNRWSSKPRRVKFWVSSPVHRRTSSRCWTWWQRMPRGYVKQ